MNNVIEIENADDIVFTVIEIKKCCCCKNKLPSKVLGLEWDGVKQKVICDKCLENTHPAFLEARYGILR